MSGGALVLVTVHGIGFQREPTTTKDGTEVAGYADVLHEHLGAELGELLGNDPDRGKGPVYVRSEFNHSRAEGLARLDGKLTKDDNEIAHVALVYSPSEPLAPRPGAVADAIARTLVAHGHYTSALGALRLVLGDAWAALHTTDAAKPDSTLLPRVDPPIEHANHGLIHRLLHGHADPEDPPPPSDPGAFGMLRALEDDVAAYVARNDLRERVRGFVQEALLALHDRDDVAGIVVNGHSQGTVLTWDVLCRLPFSSWQRKGTSKLRHYVTSGSPIRKYVDLFSWGEQVGQLSSVLTGEPDAPGWTNFFDPHDPVADPLDAATAWRPGQDRSVRPQGDVGLLVARDPAGGESRHVAILDTKVDNLTNSEGGGLQAHDYWNNQTEVVKPLAGILERAAQAAG
jgi:hypothetical protein